MSARFEVQGAVVTNETLWQSGSEPDAWVVIDTVTQEAVYVSLVEAEAHAKAEGANEAWSAEPWTPWEIAMGLDN
jgi:hypothetical protein